MLPFTFLALAAASASGVAAAPEVYPELIPGPGLPSLAELNITLADLYKENDDSVTLEDLGKRWQLRCHTKGIPSCNAADAQACVNYLNKLGTTYCTVPANPPTAVFCKIGTCGIGGSNVQANQQPARSYCRDVGCGTQQVVNSCNVNGQVEGDQAACGNGGLVGLIATKSWF